MLYANLDEVYPVRSVRSVKSVKSVKKKLKNKNNSQENEASESSIPEPHDMNTLALPKSEYESTVPLYKTVNHCNPLEAPPYKFPVSEEALEQFDKALDVMDNIENSYQDLDEYDTYLEDTPKKEEQIIKHIPKRVKKKEPKEPKKPELGSHNYEILLFIAIGLILIFMCEVIARIAISKNYS
jgi:hypothetical protein